VVNDGSCNLVVDDKLFDFKPLEVGKRYNLLGVIEYSNNLYKLLPRETLDVVTSGITTLPPGNSIEVYPNPFVDVINFNSTEKINRITVTNIVGQKVIDIKQPDKKIDASKLKRGIYLVSFYNKEGNSVVKKMVKN
jgi:GH25 family lysozyme M1 (1,4-beta-N-acetylmuramidase)